jgi:hypothetical protein
MKRLFSFVGNMLSSASDTSSKRVIAVGSFMALVGCGVASAFGHTPDLHIVDSFTILAGGASVLTVAEKLFTPKSPKGD